jgi:hypothetical protein
MMYFIFLLQIKEARSQCTSLKSDEEQLFTGKTVTDVWNNEVSWYSKSSE